jgi:hypothetical protein
MFNWQSSSDSHLGIVSSHFWIYWTFTIPLTVMVAFSWRLLWAWEKHHLDRDVLLEIENIQESASANPKRENPGHEIEVGFSKQVIRNTWESLRRRNTKLISAEKESRCHYFES